MWHFSADGLLTIQFCSSQHVPPSNKSTASIPGLDHWAFNKWGTTAPTTNSRYQMNFFQADSEIVSNSHLPKFLSFPFPKTPNLLTLWLISQYLSCSVQFDFYLSLIKRIRWTSSERHENHQPQQGQKGARGSTQADSEWTEQLWGLGKYLQKKTWFSNCWTNLFLQWQKETPTWS